MHFLCLHGNGTNSKILEMQTAALRYELGDGHTYDYGEGVFTQPLEPAVEHLVTDNRSAYSYFDISPGADALKPILDLESFIASEGPYDGVIAFSQGIMVASMLILRSIQQEKPIPFKCAVFFSPWLGPLDVGETIRTGGPVEIDPTTAAGIISVPTALIWGERDPFQPDAGKIQGFFTPEKLVMYVHPGGHEIPSAGDSQAMTKAVNVIRRVIDMASEI